MIFHGGEHRYARRVRIRSGPTIATQNPEGLRTLLGSQGLTFPGETIRILEKMGLVNLFVLDTVLLRSARGTVGRCAGPKWPKMVRATNLVKITLLRTGFWHLRDQNGPKWCIFCQNKSFLVHLGLPSVLWPLLIYVLLVGPVLRERSRQACLCGALSLSLSLSFWR